MSRNMDELGVLRTVERDDNINFYHVHTIKAYDQKKWSVGEIYDTQDFLREPSYNLPKKIRENAFEKVRQRKFGDLPTRTKCLFASTSLDTAKVWLGILGGEKQLIKIRPISGKYVFLDEEYYELENFTDDEMDKDAHMYWGGYTYLNGEKKSVLFEGVFKIEEEINI